MRFELVDGKQTERWLLAVDNDPTGLFSFDTRFRSQWVLT